MKKKVVFLIFLFLIGLLFCVSNVLCKYKYEEVISKVDIEIKSAPGIYAKLYDTTGDGIGDTLILGEHKNITYDGILIDDYNYIDNTSLGENNVWKKDISKIKKINIVEKITPSTTYNWFKDAINLTTISNSENFNMSFNTSMQGMFYNCEKLQELDVSKWDISKVTNLRETFRRCLQLQELDVSNWNTSSVVNMFGLFHSSSKLQELDVSNWNTSSVINMTSVFNGLKQIKKLNVDKWNVNNVKYTNSMFAGCESLKELDISKWILPGNTRIDYMFYNCKSLNNLDVSNFRTENVINMSHTFDGMEIVESLDVSNWKTMNVTDMSYMFYNCKSLNNLDVSNWNTSKVVTIEGMFFNCINLLELNFEKWNTSKVFTMKHTFHNCNSLTELDLSTFSSESLTNMNTMFTTWNDESSSFNESNLSKIIFGDNFTTTNVTSMHDTFSGLTKLKTLDISMFHIDNLIDARHFINGSSLNTIYVNKDFRPTSKMESDGVLYGNSLVGGNGTIKIFFDEGEEITYFQADTNDQVGLFTLKPEYHVSYELDNGILENPRIKIWEIDNDYTIPQPIKEGYIFIGWTGANGETPEKDVIIKSGSVGDRTYIANWEPINISSNIDSKSSILEEININIQEGMKVYE